MLFVEPALYSIRLTPFFCSPEVVHFIMIIDLYQYNSFFIENQQRLIHFASVYVRDNMVAEDCVIETMMEFWERRQRLPDNTNILAWVLTILKHKCIDYLRKERRLQSSNDYNDSIWELDERITALEDFDPHEIFTQEIRNIIDSTLDALPPQAKQIFILSTYENKTHQEIATITNLTLRGVEYHLYKAKDALRQSLKDYLPAMVLFVYFC